MAASPGAVAAGHAGILRGAEGRGKSPAALFAHARRRRGAPGRGGRGGMTDLAADVAVIGSGPSGATLACRLAEAGIDVLVLERGGWIDHDALARDAPDWELRRRGPLNANPNIRRAPADDPVDDADSPIKPMIGNAVGGGSVWWSAHVPRFRPEDFRVGSLDGVGADWPLDHGDLAPHYAEVEAMWGVARVPGDPSAGPGQTGPHAPMPTIGAHGRRVAAAFDRLGWHWWPVDLVVGRSGGAAGEARCTHIGPCDLGCPARIRSGADTGILGRALAAGARLETGIRVLRLESAGDRVTAALCRRGAEQEVRVEAKTYVLAANGLGTPRLLLLSASPDWPDGLANGSGLVGRGLMLHPYGRADGLFDAPLGGWAPGESAGIVSFEFLPTWPGRGFVRGLKLQLTPGPPPAALARGAVTGRPLPWGPGHHAAFERVFDRMLGMTVCAEDLAEDHNRVTLSARLRDRDGLPAARMVYRLSDNSRRALDFGLDRAAEVLREAGATACFRTPLRDQAGFHLMGTARMGTDPARSVVDSHGRCHEVANLVVADASAFVTASCVNPTATAQALALRAADRLISARKTGPAGDCRLYYK